MSRGCVVRAFFYSLLALLVCTNTSANTNITSPIPNSPAHEIIEPPAGYANCDTIGAGWVGKVWAPVHQECHYPNATHVAVWVSGYWGCTQHKSSGKCSRWVWYRSHWAKSVLNREAYYNRHEHYPYYH